MLLPRPGIGGLWQFATFSTALRDAGAAIGVAASSQRIRRVFSTIGRRQGAHRRIVALNMGHGEEVNARHYDDVELAELRSTTDLVGDSVSKLSAERGLSLEKP